MPGQFITQHDSVCARLQPIQGASGHVLCNSGSFRFQRRQHASQPDPAHTVPVKQHPLPFDERRARDHFRILRQLLRQPAPVLQLPVRLADADVGHHAQQSIPDFGMESVHDRHHGNHRGQPQRDAQRRDQRDERDETVPVACPKVTQANVQRDWKIHGMR